MLYITKISLAFLVNVRDRADCTALLWGNGLYCKLKLKREEEELTTKLKYLNKYSEC